MDTYPVLRRLAAIWLVIGFITATIIGIGGVFVLIASGAIGLLVIASGFITILTFQTISNVLLLLIDIADSLALRRNPSGAPQLNRKPKE